MKNEGVKATVSLAVGDYFSLELPKIIVFGRNNSANGAVYYIAREAKFNSRRNCLDHIFKSTNNPRALCKMTQKGTTSDCRICSQNDIEW